MNFRSIISKTSIRSSSSNKKPITRIEEFGKLHSENEMLKRTIESLKITLENRDVAIGCLAREKEQLYVKLKTAQRVNRNLHQQLVDERDIHRKEKEYLIEETKKVAQTNQNCEDKNNVSEIDNPYFVKIYKELEIKDEIICNIGVKYLKLKACKIKLQEKWDSFRKESDLTWQKIVKLLEENKRTLDSLLNKVLKLSVLPSENKNYTKLLKTHAKLQYENAQLKVFLSTRDYIKLKQLCESNRSTMWYNTPTSDRIIDRSKVAKKHPLHFRMKSLREKRRLKLTNQMTGKSLPNSPYSEPCLASSKN